MRPKITWKEPKSQTYFDQDTGVPFDKITVYGMCGKIEMVRITYHLPVDKTDGRWNEIYLRMCANEDSTFFESSKIKTIYKSDIEKGLEYMQKMAEEYLYDSWKLFEFEEESQTTKDELTKVS